MKAFHVLCGVLAALLASFGAVALGEHARLWESHFGGAILIAPAMMLQIGLRLVGVDIQGGNLITDLSEGWPFLTVVGVVTIYVLPAVTLAYIAGWRHLSFVWHDAESGTRKDA